MLFLAVLLAAAPAHAAHPAPRHRSAHRVVRKNASARAIVTTASGLRIQTLRRGAGERPGPDDMVLIDYEGRLANGKVFDKSTDPAELSVSGVIPGFSEALQLMNKGGTYRAWIPGKLAYGERGAGGGVIPPNAELTFTITLRGIKHRPATEAPARRP
jgi:FKBP-type peptidyl-prolyl cis-trans isomerase FkpA